MEKKIKTYTYTDRDGMTHKASFLPENLSFAMGEAKALGATKMADIETGDTITFQKSHTSIYTPKIQKAIRFATRVHEVDQKQKRKGKDEAYISHPLIVGLILSRATDDEDVITAGILHDTVEDCHPDHPVTLEMIEKEFGPRVADLAVSVTEENPDASYDERKKRALDHVAHMTEDQILIKSADVIANMTEFIHDYEEIGDQVFERFNTDKFSKIKTQLWMLYALIEGWFKNPLTNDLSSMVPKIYDIGGTKFMREYPAQRYK